MSRLPARAGARGMIIAPNSAAASSTATSWRVARGPPYSTTRARRGAARYTHIPVLAPQLAQLPLRDREPRGEQRGAEALPRHAPAPGGVQGPEVLLHALLRRAEPPRDRVLRAARCRAPHVRRGCAEALVERRRELCARDGPVGRSRAEPLRPRPGRLRRDAWHTPFHTVPH
jgi:hypothetical protein